MMTPQALQTSLSQVNGITVIHLSGEINGFARERMETVSEQALSASQGAIILDFSAVDYINSTGIALIVKLLMSARQTDRRLSACGLSEHYQEVFSITRLADFIHIYPDLDTALAGEQSQN